ncbi:MAG: N-acetyltransferase [Candidatus Omnitrophota bacterium]
MKIRRAKLADADKIHCLINRSAEKGDIIPRSLSEIYESLRDFTVAEEGGRMVGCCALHISWENLAEVRSLVVIPERQGKGLGGTLLRTVLREAKRLTVPRVFALTNKPLFFRKYGFEPVNKERLPHKIWGDCLKCPKFPKCDEVALWKKLS